MSSLFPNMKQRRSATSKGLKSLSFYTEDIMENFKLFCKANYYRDYFMAVVREDEVTVY